MLKDFCRRVGLKCALIWTPHIMHHTIVEGGETEFTLEMIGLVRLFPGETYDAVTLPITAKIYPWIGETYAASTLEMTSGATFTVT